jgi:tRNA (guanine37-N1)-methyltransferase
MPKIKFTIITLFPEALKPYLDSSMLYKAQDRGIIAIEYVNLRDFGLGPHKSVDDTPYGGGDGMLLRCEPVFAAIESVKATSPDAEVILPTPVGMTWNQDLARQFAGANGVDAQSQSQEAPGGASTPGAPSDPTSSISGPKTPQNASGRHYIILCPHYEGYDERILTIVDHKISLGNYVLTGGELPALILIDSISRLLPGVLGGETSALIESFSDGDNLEYPQYTKPADFRGLKVPEILLSGDHGKIAAWRAEHSGKKAN